MKEFDLPRKKLLFVVLVLDLFLMLAPSIWEVKAAEQGKGLIPIADSHVSIEGPDNNWGKSWSLFVDGNSIETLTFLMFDLSQVPLDASVESAKLRLYAYAVSYEAPLGVHYCPSNDWTEMGLTYNNMPSFSPTPEDTVNVTNELVWYEWNMTDSVQTAFEKPDRKITLVLQFQADTRGSVAFRSRNSPTLPPPHPDYSPQLLVFYDAPPPSADNTQTITAIIILVLVGATAVGLELAYFHHKRKKTTQPTQPPQPSSK